MTLEPTDATSLDALLASTLQRTTAGSLQAMELLGIADRFNAA